jgi:hypothetical protein
MALRYLKKSSSKREKIAKIATICSYYCRPRGPLKIYIFDAYKYEKKEEKNPFNLLQNAI